MTIDDKDVQRVHDKFKFLGSVITTNTLTAHRRQYHKDTCRPIRLAIARQATLQVQLHVADA